MEVFLKIVVCVKHVPDPLTVEICPETGAIGQGRLLYIVNPPDLCAVEKAVSIRKQRAGGEVVAISLGPPPADEALRACLAIGADRGVRLWDEALRGTNACVTALVLSEAIKREGCDLVLCGTASVDKAGAQVGAYIAELLGFPHISCVTSLELSGDGQKAIVHRRLEHGKREALECLLPALFTVESSLNEPHYPSLPDYMEALRATISVIDLSKLGLCPDLLHIVDSPKVISTVPPRPRPKAIFTPDSKLSASERIALILSGGLAVKKRVLIEGSPEELADEIVRFMIDKGIVSI